MASHRVVLAASIPFFVLASIFVGLCTISSIFVVKKLRLNDYLMLLAWLIDVGFMASLFVATGKGLGIHELDIKPSSYYGLDRADYVFTFLFGPASMAVKSSVLTFYLTLTQGSKVFHRANYITLFIVNAGGLALTIVEAVSCIPLGTKEHCTEVFMVALASSPFEIITDIIILFLPIPRLTRMRLPWKQKLILVIAFSTGFGVIVVDVIRTAFLQNAVITHRITNNPNPDGYDTTYFASVSFIWASIEVNMTIICACIPSLKPLADRFYPWIIGDVDKSAPATSQDSTRSIRAGDMMTALTTPSGQPREVQPYITIFGISEFKPASLPRLNNKKSLPPLVFITVVVVLRGGTYALLDCLYPKFISIGGLSELHELGLRSVYFGGYLLGPLFMGRPLLKTSGYRNTFITAFCVYACGTFLFWPSGVLTSYIAFVVSNFIVGFGLGVLETAYVSFIVICGPLENCEIRLAVVYAFWAFGGAISYAFEEAILRDVRDVVSLANVQWVFLGVALFDVLLAVSFWYVRLPEASDEELEELANRRDDNLRKVARVPVTRWTLALGLFCGFFLQAASELARNGTRALVKAVGGRYVRLELYEYRVIGRVLYGASRLLIALCLRYFKPRWLLLAVNISAMVSAILCTKVSGLAAIVMGLLVEFCQGGAYPLSRAISLRGQGRHTKTAGALLSAVLVAGVFGIFLRYVAAVAHGDQYSYNVAVASWSVSTIFPLYLNLVPAARKQVDPVINEYLHE
ncbi:hypothetical protein ZTR_05014 [Talaromyces verruculosus]|nr:hypothetical protein ZTR_05014 [Talaromyces verruculosus]